MPLCDAYGVMFEGGDEMTAIGCMLESTTSMVWRSWLRKWQYENIMYYFSEVKSRKITSTDQQSSRSLCKKKKEMARYFPMKMEDSNIDTQKK